jgi:hypothetical protein
MKSLEPDHNQIRTYLACMLMRAGPAGFFSLRGFFDDEIRTPFHISSVSLVDGLDVIIDCAIGVAIWCGNAKRPVVFCPALAIFNNAYHARERDLLQGLALSTECDAHPNEARERLEKLLGPPTALVRSGGVWINGSGVAEDKLHQHWRLARPTATDEDHARLKLARRLAAQIAGADRSNIPLIHGTRCPGSWHRKKEPRLCEIVAIDTKREIELDAVLATLTAAAPAPAAATSVKKKASEKPTRAKTYEKPIGDNDDFREIHQKYPERKASQLSMEEILNRRHDSLRARLGPARAGWLRRELLGPGQVGSECRHRMHFKLACFLEEGGVPALEGFTCLVATNWNKHDDDDDKVWTLVDRVWSRRLSP